MDYVEWISMRRHENEMRIGECKIKINTFFKRENIYREALKNHVKYYSLSDKTSSLFLFFLKKHFLL